MAGILKVDRVQSDSNLAFQVASANVAYINSTGLNITGGEIIAGGSTLRTTSGLIYANNGISFPATQVSSSDPNTLDDYEEGTWTPTVNLLGTISYGIQQGKYVKIGRYVWVSFYMYYTSSDTTQDNNVMFLQNLPYAVSSTSAYGTSCLMTERMYGVSSTTAPNTFHVEPEPNSSTLRVTQNNYNGSITNASYFVSQVRSCYKGSNQYMLGTIFYEATT